MVAHRGRCPAISPGKCSSTDALDARALAGKKPSLVALHNSIDMSRRQGADAKIGRSGHLRGLTTERCEYIWDNNKIRCA